MTSATRLPQAPHVSNGKRIALVGAGCASLTVANDLIPLGYECVIFEALDTPGGLMRTNIPAFRLPASVLDEEIAYIVDMGVDLRLSHPIESMRALLEEDFDAVFVGSGAPKGKELRLPGRADTDRIHIGIQWLESIAFGHVSSVGERVLIIGVGNTAMDCCRSSLRRSARRTSRSWRASPAPSSRRPIGNSRMPRRSGGRNRRQSFAEGFPHRRRQAGRHEVRCRGVRVR